MSVKLIRPIDQRVITESEKEDVAGTVLDPRFLEDGIGEIDLPRPLLTIKGRVWIFGRDEPYSIDPDMECIEDWMLTNTVKIPHIPNYEIASGIETIDTIRWRANNLLKTCIAFTRGDATAKNLQSSLCRLQDQIVRCILGKNVVLTSDVLSVRCKNSMRGVAVPEPMLDPFDVALPICAAAEAGIKTGDWVFLVRQPVLFEGGILLQRATLWSKRAIGCNAFVNKPLGLDFDGDTVEIFQIPTWEKGVRDELTDKPLEDIRSYAQWSGEMLLYNSSQQVNWNDPQADVESRMILDGTTFGPSDTLDVHNCRFANLADISGCKPMLEDVDVYGNGVDLQKFMEESESAHNDIVRMKLHIGAIGALTDKICQLLLQNHGPIALSHALKFKELVTQTVLDAKHGISGYSIEPIVEIFERRGIWATSSEKKALAYLTDIGLGSESTKLIVEAVWMISDGSDKSIGVTKAVRRDLPLFATTRYGVGPADLIRFVDSPHRESSAAQHALNASNVNIKRA